MLGSALRIRRRLARAEGLLVTLLVLPALAAAISGLAAPLGGSHSFRQAHVAANIDKFVENGISLRPATYNDDVPFSAFDFPLYQLTVAEVCRLAGADPLRTARLASLLLFVATLVVLHRLMVQAGVGRWPARAAIVLYAWAPLDLFYFQAPMVDDLAVLLAFVSLQQFVRGQSAGKRSRVSVLLLASGFLSTLIKSPVYLPVFLAMLWHRARTRGARALWRWDIAALGGVAGLGVLCFKIYWMLVNGASDVLTPWERRHYFGTLTERFQPAAWAPVLSDLLRFTTNPVAALLAVLGVFYWVRRSKGPSAPIFTGLLVGCGVTLLVFFDRFPPHNYYQLPFVFPLAFFGAQGLQVCRVLGRVGRRFGRPALRASRVAIPLALLATAAWGWIGRDALAANHTTDAMRSRGEWIHEHTTSHDYVVYVFEGPEDDWNPAYLYFAKRDGINLPLQDLTPARLAVLEARARERSEDVVAFGFRDEDNRLLAGLGGVPLAGDGRRRVLFRFDPVRPPAHRETLQK